MRAHANDNAPLGEVVPIAHVAADLKFHPESIRHWCRTYPGVGVKIGGQWRVHKAAWEALRAGSPLSAFR